MPSPPVDAGAAPLEPPTASDPTPEWVVHDRTHLELTHRYAFSSDAPFEWEMYAFVPKSFRLRQQAYVRENLYDDLQSRFRLNLAPRSLNELRDRLPVPTSVSDEESLVREMQLFASGVRTAAVSEQQALSELSAEEQGPRLDALLADGPALAKQMREVFDRLPGSLREVSRRIDEHVSRVLEVLYGSLSQSLEASEGRSELASRLADAAAAEARYRRDVGLGAVGRRGLSEREAEHLEFRAHALKRFTSTALWLNAEVRTAGAWAKHVFYAVAAGLAMSFSLAAALWHGPQTGSFTANLLPWAVAVVVAYMGKDRVKALLQDTFSGWLSKYFPDRVWRLSRLGTTLAQIREESGFLSSRRLPDEVRSVRERYDRGPFSRVGRTETVLWHRKEVRVTRRAARSIDSRFDSIVEIFRLDVLRWLTHADDATRTIVFADPEDGHVYESPARRAYNIQLIYRLRQKGDEAPWHRARVVVTRTGILRIDDLDRGWTPDGPPDTLSDRVTLSSHPPSAAPLRPISTPLKV